MAFVLFRYHQYFFLFFQHQQRGWRQHHGVCFVSVFVNNIAFVCSGMNNIAFACSGNLEKNQIENLDRTSVTSLVWHDSVKKGEERLRDFERLSQSSHARVTSVKSKQGQGVNE